MPITEAKMQRAILSDEPLHIWDWQTQLKKIGIIKNSSSDNVNLIYDGKVFKTNCCLQLVDRFFVKRGIPNLDKLSDNEQKGLIATVRFAHVDKQKFSSARSNLNGLSTKILSDEEVIPILVKFGFTRKDGLFLAPGFEKIDPPRKLVRNVHFFCDLNEVGTYVRENEEFAVEINGIRTSRRIINPSDTDYFSLRLWGAMCLAPLPKFDPSGLDEEEEQKNSPPAKKKSPKPKHKATAASHQGQVKSENDPDIVSSNSVRKRTADPFQEEAENTEDELEDELLIVNIELLEYRKEYLERKKKQKRKQKEKVQEAVIDLTSDPVPIKKEEDF